MKWVITLIIQKLNKSNYKMKNKRRGFPLLLFVGSCYMNLDWNCDVISPKAACKEP